MSGPDCDVINGLVSDPLHCHCDVCVKFRPYKLRPSTTRSQRLLGSYGWDRAEDHFMVLDERP
jgi:hypothetical protein